MVCPKSLMLLALAPVVALAQGPPAKVPAAAGKIISSDIIRPPSVVCIGGQPTNAQPPCSPGTKRILLWNSVVTHQYGEIAGPIAAYVRGPHTVVMHCSLDENYAGHCWGTHEWPIAGMDGKWEGVWEGEFDLLANTAALSSSGYGDGGKLAGLQVKCEGVFLGNQPGVWVCKIAAK